MLPTAFVYSQRYLDHDTGPAHPERPERLRAIHRQLEQSGSLKRCLPIEPTPADPSLVERVHDRDHIERFRRACLQHAPIIDTPDCPISPASFDVALLAAGGVIAAVDAVMQARARNAFCAVRPPGHHAERRMAMGFCFFNNVAIAAEFVHARYGIEHVAILDWDVHHGNGTQHHFEADPDVFFCSIHQHPATLYPGTGYAGERGRGPGLGTTLNVPMSPGSGDEEYQQAFDEQILPALSAFKPGFILVSAGFDAHRDDPLAHIELSTEMFGWMTSRVVQLAESLCGGRLVSTLEGGYNLSALADSVQTHLESLSSGNSNPPRGV